MSREAIRFCRTLCRGSLAIACTLLICQLPAQSSRDVLKQAEQFIERELYWEALANLESYCQDKPNDLDAKTILADMYLKTNQYQKALDSYELVSGRRRRTSAQVILGLAQARHNLGAFGHAARDYKRYLLMVEEDDEQREQVIDQLRRCEQGVRHAAIDTKVVVENMGKAINSQQHDLMPVESPNHQGTVYFSSGRQGRFVDDFDKRGTLRSSQKLMDFEMLVSTIVGGAWSSATPLNADLSSSADEFLLDFTSDGMVAIFARSGVDQFEFLVDTFDAEKTWPSPGEPWVGAIDFSGYLPQGVYFFSDSVAIFASDQLTGYGGYDLYLATIDRGSQHAWKVMNLGPDLNTAYDEVSPFLAQDGRTLYYSSNGTSSMGGFDIFSSRYLDRQQTWSVPQNLGRPINSGSHDMFFRLSRDGVAGYFSSDRAGTEGGLDLHSIYYQNAQSEQVTRSIPVLFSQVPAYVLFRQSLAEDRTQMPVEQDVGTEFVMPSLFFGVGGQIMTPQNMNKLNQVTSFLKTYPHVSVEIASFSDIDPVSNFDLFASLQRGHEVADFLERQGIPALSLIVRGYGGSYPLAHQDREGGSSTTGRWFNRRVDLIVLEPSQVPLQIKTGRPELSPAIQNERVEVFEAMRDGLSYRIHVADLDQMFKGELLTSQPDPMAAKLSTGEYRYYSGLFASFEDALKHLILVKGRGFVDARIVPFIDGVRFQKSALNRDLLDRYPDLKEYVLFID